MEQAGAVVVGAGVVGLAVAHALSRAGHEVLVVERHARPGEETSSRNSGVIHSGLYYPTDSLKARLCTRGRELLYAYAARRGIPHRRCGKLLVAQPGQLASLRQLADRGRANGVALRWLEEAEARRLEPAVRCAAALLSEDTGIISVPDLVLALQADLEAAGGALVLRAAVRAVRRLPGGFELDVQQQAQAFQLGCRVLVNAAGLDAVELAARMAGMPPRVLPGAYFAKGSYFVCRRLRPFSRLIYPLPGEAGLGIHATLDLDGSLRFGPDVEWVDRPDYDVDPRRAPVFHAAIREYWPDLPEGALQPGYAGVRPKLVGPGAPAADFLIQGPRHHGVPGLVNLLGIESPGLTSALAIGEQVAVELGIPL